MIRYSTSDLSRKTGDIIAEALRHPVVLTQHDKDRLVLMSVKDYEKLTQRDTRKAYRLKDTPPQVLDEMKAALEDYKREGGE